MLSAEDSDSAAGSESDGESESSEASASGSESDESEDSDEDEVVERKTHNVVWSIEQSKDAIVAMNEIFSRMIKVG